MTLPKCNMSYQSNWHNYFVNHFQSKHQLYRVQAYWKPRIYFQGRIFRLRQCRRISPACSSPAAASSRSRDDQTADAAAESQPRSTAALRRATVVRKLARCFFIFSEWWDGKIELKSSTTWANKSHFCENNFKSSSVYDCQMTVLKYVKLNVFVGLTIAIVLSTSFKSV